MRIGKVIGTVTPSRIHSRLTSGQLKIVLPFTFADLKDELAEGKGGSSVEKGHNDLFDQDETFSPERARVLLAMKNPTPAGTEVVVYDELSAGVGEWIAFSEGAEAAMPFYPEMKPIDAYAAAIIDTLTIEKGRALD